MNIQKLIKIRLHESLLNEDYDSINDISKFADNYFKQLAELTYHRLQDWSKNDDHNFSFPTLNLPQICADCSQYKKIGDFLKKSRFLEIKLIKGDDNQERHGNYTHIPYNKYNPNIDRLIRLFYKPSFMGEIKEKINNIDENDLFRLYQREFKGHLIHELQHAYDDYRSDTKMFKSKEFEKYISKTESPEYLENKDKKEFEQELYKSYLNLPHEIWARFTQAIDETSFMEMDFNDDLTDIFYKMTPINDVIRSFRWNFQGFKVLPDKIKKKLYNKVVQFWHKEQEQIQSRSDELRKKNGL